MPESFFLIIFFEYFFKNIRPHFRPHDIHESHWNLSNPGKDLWIKSFGALFTLSGLTLNHFKIGKKTRLMLKMAFTMKDIFFLT